MTARPPLGTAGSSWRSAYTYSANGKATSVVDANGNMDALNQVSVKVVPERTGPTTAQTRDVYYEYDNRGLQTPARFDHVGGEGVTNMYDGFGQFVSSSSDMAGTARAVLNV